MPDLDADLTLAGALADKARAAASGLFRSGLAADDKAGRDGAGRGDYDPVTEADRRIEAAIVAALAEARPDDGILGEEGAERASKSGRTWVIDPIDGTRAFIAGLPTWCVLIALCDADGPALSVIDQPFTSERFYGADRAGLRGAWLARDGVRDPIRAGGVRRIDEAILSTTDPDLFQDAERAAFERVKDAARLTRYGLDAYAYAALALGGVHLVVESGLKPWDVCALAPVVRGAGGVISAWDGGAMREGGRVVAAATPDLHDAARALLNA